MPTQTELTILIEAQDRASGLLQSVGKDVERLERQVTSAGGAFGGLGSAVRGLGQLGLAAGGAGVVLQGIQSSAQALFGLVEQAGDLNEQVSRSDQIFLDAATSVQRFAQTTGLALGISQTQALEAAGSFGTLFRTAGLGPDAAAEMSTSLVRLAADLASFNNIDPSEALEKLRSGLVGEAEPLRAVGVLLSEDAVATKALQLGLATTTKELTEAQKVQARYALILEQTTRAQGDFSRTSGGLANMQRILRAAWQDIQTTLGGALLPTVTRLFQSFVQQLPRITAAVQTLASQAAPILEKLFSGDFKGALDQFTTTLGPTLARWSEAFWGWVSTMTPELLQRLGALTGKIVAWIQDQSPIFLEKLIGEWIPAFIDWVVKVLPPLMVELGKVIAALVQWANTEGKPQLEALGVALGGAVVVGFGKAMEKLGPLVGDILKEQFQETGATGSAVAIGTALNSFREWVNRQTPPLAPLVSPQAQARLTNGQTVNVDVGGVAVTGVGGDPAAIAQQVGDQVAAEVLASLTRSAATTDVGATNRLQGGGR